MAYLVLCRALKTISNSQVLTGYLKEIDDLETRYSLAVEVGLYAAALEALVDQRDRERVKNFINSVPPVLHYEMRKKIEHALENTVSGIRHRVECACMCACVS